MSIYILRHYENHDWSEKDGIVGVYEIEADSIWEEAGLAFEVLISYYEDKVLEDHKDDSVRMTVDSGFDNGGHYYQYNFVGGYGALIIEKYEAIKIDDNYRKTREDVFNFNPEGELSE